MASLLASVLESLLKSLVILCILAAIWISHLQQQKGSRRNKDNYNENVNALNAVSLFALLSSSWLDHWQWKKKKTTVSWELQILEEASMQVSHHLLSCSCCCCCCYYCLPESGIELPKQQQERKDALLQFIQMIQGPQSSNTTPINTTNNNKIQTHQQQQQQQVHNENQLQVLGGCLWFRFHFQKGISLQAIKDLIYSLKQQRQQEKEFTPAGLKTNTVQSIVSWAVLPKDRGLISYCLDVLSWVFRRDVDNDCEKQSSLIFVSALPEQVLTILMEEVIRAYYKANDDHIEEPELIHSLHYSEASTAQQSTPTRESEDNSSIVSPNCYEQYAQRIYGYLHFLHVLMVAPPAKGLMLRVVGDSAEKEITSTTTAAHDADSSSPCYPSHNSYRLRPGILKSLDRPPRLSHRWNQTFLRRVMDELDIDGTTNPDCYTFDDVNEISASTKSTTRPLDNSIFLLQQLPASALQLRCYTQAIQLLYHNPDFTKARMKYLGLYPTVKLYIQEWKHLHQSLQDSLCTEFDNHDVPLDLNSTSSFSFLADACLSECAAVSTTERPINSNNNSGHTVLQQPNDDKVSKQYQRVQELQSTGQASYLLAVHITSSSSSSLSCSTTVTLALQLFNQARHLQLLALKQQSRRVSKAMHNLAKTLWARQGVSKKKAPPPVSSNEDSDAAKQQQYSPEKYHVLSCQLLENIAKISEEYYRRDSASTISERALVSMALMLARHLSRVWSEVQPLVMQPLAQMSEVKEQQSVHWELPLQTLTGLTFRQFKIHEQFQLAQDILNAFCHMQRARIRLLPCETAEVQTTEQLLLALQKFQIETTTAGSPTSS